MRITYRDADNTTYWEDRWRKLKADDPCGNKDVYPLKYAKMVVSKDDRILEAGCGLGRVLRYYHNKGYSIEGFDFIENAVNAIKAADSSIQVSVGNVTKMNYPDGVYDTVLAFGLYHNLPLDLWASALDETWRVMRFGGRLCASARADNWANRINDWLKKRKSENSEKTNFHKINLSKKEYVEQLRSHGFKVEAVHYVINMPILYKAKCFRHRAHKIFNESVARRDGYLLNEFGRFLQALLMTAAPQQFCNIYVVIATKANKV